MLPALALHKRGKFEHLLRACAGAPLMLTSRAEDEQARLTAAAVAVLHCHWKSTGVRLVQTEAAA
jgi:hypothetical protein